MFGAPELLGYTIRRVDMSGAKRQIDLAKQTRVPEQGDESDLSPSKAAKVADGGPTGSLGVSAADLQAMLAQQTAQLVQTQEAAVARAVARFESVVQERVGAAETRVSAVEERLQSLELKLTSALESGSGKLPARAEGDDGPRRLRTLIYGGWARDTRRSDILAELQKALSSLRVEKLLDDPPFTTGVRRSIALSSFRERPGESLSDVRGRMQQVIRAFYDSEVTGKQGKKLWCNWSKSKQERAHSSHAALVKRVVGEADRVKLLELDVEWNQGSVWTHQGLIASSAVPVPPGVAASDLVVRDGGENKPWINVAQAARDLRIDEAAQLQP